MKILHTQTTVLLEKLFKLERCGKYDEALDELKDIWEDHKTFPNVGEYKPRTAAEIILRCGSLSGFNGHNKQIPNSQEISKDLLTEAHNRFLTLCDVERIAECENYLALAYWRTGELKEAKSFIETALSHALPNSNHIRLYSYIIESKIDFANSEYNKILQISANLHGYFLNHADNCLKGDFYNHCGLALKNLNNLTDALKNFELARYYHQKAGHQIYLAIDENNLAQLYKLENKFTRAHKAADSATNIFKQINDKTREGFSLDTKAQIYFAEKQYADALKSVEKAIAILDKSENKAYLVESYSTKAKTLIYLDDFPSATFCLFEAVQIAKKHISEEAAKKLVKEYESVLQEKNSSVIEEMFSGKSLFEERLELVLPPSLSHYDGIQGVWIKNNHLQSIGLRKGSLAVVANEKINGGDLAAIVEIESDAISCGFYDAAFGIVCLEGINSEPQLFDEKDVRILGKIIGVCKSEKSFDGRMIVEPI